MKISICIPVYEQKGLGLSFLRHNLDVISRQTFTDFEVIVSDDSTYFAQAAIEAECKRYAFVKYFRNEKKGISANTNNAIKHAMGDLIKIIFQDDFLFNGNSLQDIVDNFKGGWMVSACEHTEDGHTMIRPFYPKYNQEIYLGNNTISSPSVLTIKNDNPLLFDENLTMLMDVDYYKRCYDKFGEPTILNKINVVNTVGNHQVSQNITASEMEEELNYIKEKYVSRTM
jgi:glycosyltransferase involved in cell wall biosynthesis